MKIVTVYNRKGGVGKTAIAVLLAEGLAYFNDLRVLVVDGDGQRHSSQRLCPIETVNACDCPSNPKNICQYFLKAVATPHSLPNPANYISKDVGTIRCEKGSVDILMGSNLIDDAEGDFQSRKTLSKTTIFGDLVKAFRNLEKGGYDVVVVDTQPGLSVFVQSAVSAADLVVFPIRVQDTSPFDFHNVQWHFKRQLPATGFTSPEVLPIANIYETHHGKLLASLIEWINKPIQIKIDKQNKIEQTVLFNTQMGSSPKEKYGVRGEKQQKQLVSEVSRRLGLPKKQVLRKRVATKKAAKKQVSKKRVA